MSLAGKLINHPVCQAVKNLFGVVAPGNAGLVGDNNELVVLRLGVAQQTQRFRP